MRGFKAIHVHKSNQETMQQIIQAISPEYETEEILVLNKNELLRFLDESKISLMFNRENKTDLMNFA